MQFVLRKPDPAVVRASLRRNLALFGAVVVAVRAAPYVLHLLQETEA